MLRVEGITTKYDMVEAVRDVSLEVTEGEVVAVLGPNGAGKTTILKSIMGLLKVSAGRVMFRGQDITGLRVDERVGKGLCLMPEGRRIFGEFTVKENLEMGAYSRRKANLSSEFDEVFGLFPVLKERASQVAATLSGGEQTMLSFGRALMQKPSIVLMDEPSLGLAPLVVQRLMEVIRELNKRGTTVLLVEQNAVMGLEVSSRAYVLETGSIVFSGPSAKLWEDPIVRSVYLGIEMPARVEPGAEGAPSTRHNV